MGVSSFTCPATSAGTPAGAVSQKAHVASLCGVGSRRGWWPQVRSDVVRAQGSKHKFSSEPGQSCIAFYDPASGVI